MGMKDIASRVSAAVTNAQATINAKIAQVANSRAGDAAKVAISTGKTLLSALETARPDLSTDLSAAALDSIDAYIDGLRGDIDSAQQTLDQMQREGMMAGETPAAVELAQNTNDLMHTIAETPVEVNVDGPIVFTDTSVDRGVTVETTRELPYFNLDIDKAIERAQQAESDIRIDATENLDSEALGGVDDSIPPTLAEEAVSTQEHLDAGNIDQTATLDAWIAQQNATEEAWSAQQSSTLDGWMSYAGEDSAFAGAVAEGAEAGGNGEAAAGAQAGVGEAGGSGAEAGGGGAEAGGAGAAGGD